MGQTDIKFLNLLIVLIIVLGATLLIPLPYSLFITVPFCIISIIYAYEKKTHKK